MTPVSSRLPCTSRSADNTFPCSTSEPLCDGVESEVKECAKSHCSSESYMPPVPFSQDVSPQSDHGVDTEDEVLGQEKRNAIPTGHQIPRTPKVKDKMLKLYLEEDTCSNEEAHDTGLPLDIPERCGKRDCTQGEENGSVEQKTSHMASNEPSPPFHLPLQAIKMLHITSPTESSDDSPRAVDGGLPVHCVLSPPSGYKNDETFSNTCSKSLEGTLMSEFSPLKSLSENHSPEDGCVQTNMTQVMVSRNKNLATVFHGYESPPSSDSSCENSTFQDSLNESPVLVRNYNSPSSSVVASGEMNKSSSSEGTLSAESPASIISNNEGTFVCNTEGTYILGNEGTYVCNSEGTEITFSCKTDGTYVLDNEGTFVCSSGSTNVCSNEKTHSTDNERTYICNIKSTCEEPKSVEKTMENIGIENEDNSDCLFTKYGSEDDQKHFIANEKDVSVLCENLELNCSLKENISPGVLDSEVSHAEQGTPLAQNATYILSAKKLPGKTSRNVMKREPFKDLNDTSIIQREHLSEKINSEKSIADIKEIIKDKTTFNATSSAENDTVIHQMLNEKLYMRDDNDSFEIFLHKRKAPRENDKALGIFAHLTEKPPEAGNPGEAKKATRDLECPILNEPKVVGKSLGKKKVVEENCEQDPLEETETGTENFVGVHFDKSMKMVLKESNKQNKKERLKMTGKEADTGDEEETISRQKKGKCLNKTCDVTDVHKQKEADVEFVKETARGRRCKQMKNYDENLSPSCVIESDDDSWIFTEKNRKKAKSNAKKNKENQNSRYGKEKGNNNAASKGNTEEIERKTKDEASDNENIMKCTDQNKMDVDESSQEMDMKSESHQKEIQDAIPENKIPEKPKGQKNKNEEVPYDEDLVRSKGESKETKGPLKPMGKSKKGEEVPDIEAPVKRRGRKKKTEDVPVKLKERNKNSEEVPDGEVSVKPRGRKKKTDLVPDNEVPEKPKGRSQKREGVSDEVPVKPKGRSKKSENSDNEPRVNAKGKSKNPEEIPENETSEKHEAESKKSEVLGNETFMKPKGRKKKNEAVPDNEAPLKPKAGRKKTDEFTDKEVSDDEVLMKGRRNKSEETIESEAHARCEADSNKTNEFPEKPKESSKKIVVPDNEIPVKPRGRSKKTEEAPDIEASVKPKGRRKKTDEDPVKPKANSKKAEKIPQNETYVNCETETKKTEELPEIEASVKPKGRRKKSDEVTDEVSVKPKGRSKKDKEAPDEEVLVKPKGRSKKTELPEIETSMKANGRKKKTEEVPDKETPVKPKGRTKKTEAPNEEAPMRPKGRRKASEEEASNEATVKPKGRRKKAEGVPDEAPVRVKGRQKSKGTPKTENQTSDDEMEVECRDNEEKGSVREATGSETEKINKKIQGSNEKDTDGESNAGVTRGRRTCKAKARAAISELLNDSWS
ncbi:hypothetical protein E2C01_004528 [Portunus trituberculatus]|uniref:Uncharacterized protein n=1 Tax=Portunus trituberculatus TaxID=210409 RepID=A0A5B7CWM5_PORTR|nr:hypothetical protein [Portunus trituberculatus]